MAVAVILLITQSSCGGGSGKGPEPIQNIGASGDRGKAIYSKICQACHQEHGEGIPGSFPPLAKSDFLGNKEATIAQVLNGKTGEITVNGMKFNNIMPAQGTTLGDAEIADVLNYVYSNFGNAGTQVSADEVKAIRGK